jgi:hypothetical protein
MEQDLVNARKKREEAQRRVEQTLQAVETGVLLACVRARVRACVCVCVCVHVHLDSLCELSFVLCTRKTYTFTLVRTLGGACVLSSTSPPRPTHFTPKHSLIRSPIHTRPTCSIYQPTISNTAQSAPHPHTHPPLPPTYTHCVSTPTALNTDATHNHNTRLNSVRGWR